MKDIADRIEEALREGEYEPCKYCKMDAVCERKKLYCMTVIKAKLRGQENWEPPYKEEH